MDHSWIPLSAWRRLHLLDAEKWEPNQFDLPADFPVMSATVLALDSLLHDPSIDLLRAAQVILSDVGATIQVLRLVGREFDIPAQRLSRMGDCLASLDVGTWFGAISAAPSFPADRDHTGLTSMWRHCRLVAQYAQLVAESLDGVSPDDAYLVGLLHEVEAIAAFLGWPGRDAATRSVIEESLPLFVLAAMRVVNDACPLSTWRCILTEAHELAGTTTECDSGLLPAMVVSSRSAGRGWHGTEALISSHSILTESSPSGQV